MAKILSFEPRPSVGAHSAARPDLPAIVLIFPGVRYERPAAGEGEGHSRPGEVKPGPSGTVQ
jgi:hypothetical protein